LPIAKVAESCGIQQDEYDLYGTTKAKVSLGIRDRLAGQQDGNYVVVTGITPTPLGEGKSTTVIGLAQALGAHLGKKAFACIRQPSQGPTFGMKGGAAGGEWLTSSLTRAYCRHLSAHVCVLTAAI
jgi:formyltetrahydrofolate synthetase